MAREPLDADRNADLAAKVAFLRRPEAYPDRPSTVEAKETHMSWVFLTDSRVYKLKKPVRYAFLDFSTVEARRVNCEREVRLNSRLAPGVYLGTVSLRRDAAGQLHLDGPGRVVDWLVKTRRLAADRTLEHAIVSRQVSEDDVRRLARRLATFFRRARRVPLRPDAYCRRFADDLRFNQTELSRPAYGLSRDLVREVAAAQAGFLDARRELLEERARQGRIVEGHGDLRPEHIYLNQAPLVIDCLEFNRDLRVLDPADELAYLAMECERLKAPFVEPLIFASFRDATADDPPRALIDFYKCSRAYLRARIAIAHLSEPPVRERARWIARTDEYLRLARGYATALARADEPAEGAER